MASFTAGTTFTDGVANDVTAAKLAALVNAATPTSGFIQDRTAETAIAADDTLLFGDFSDSNNLKRMTVANFNNVVTTGTGTAASPAIVPTGDTNTGIFFPAADTIAFSEGGAEAMRIDSSGRVGIGGTPSTLLHLQATSPSLRIQAASGNSGALDFYRTASVNSGQIASESTNALVFSTNGVGNSGLAERLRIDSSGNLLVGTTSGQNGEKLLAQNSSATNPSFIAYSPSATFTGYVTRIFADRNTSDSTYNFLSCARVATAGDVFIIRDSGNAVNTNNSYGSISDIKLKENIEDAASQWNDIKSIQVRKFSFKNDEGHKRMLGLVAQEVELISPNLVETVIDRDKDGSDLGTTTKEVKYSVLYMKAVKALQEAMGRIEQLESKVAALEAA